MAKSMAEKNKSVAEKGEKYGRDYEFAKKSEKSTQMRIYKNEKYGFCHTFSHTLCHTFSLKIG